VEVVSITGLHGTGKTTPAKALGSIMSAVVLSRDPLIVSFKPEESRSRPFRIRGSRAIPNWVMTSSRPFFELNSKCGARWCSSAL
jgi:SpoVK/Ycf46/Vps4 family AAA+-type ATPase